MVYSALAFFSRLSWHIYHLTRILSYFLLFVNTQNRPLCSHTQNRPLCSLTEPSPVFPQNYSAHRTVPLCSGMTRAKGWGLKSITFQAKLTAIAVNLKRIAALVDDKWGDTPAPFTQIAVFQISLSFIFNFKTSKALSLA